MSREVKTDADKLISFFNDYSLKDNLKNKKYEIELRTMHKKIYGMLLFCSEIEHQNKLKTNSFPLISLEYLNETCSDSLQAIFCWVHGAYKPANSMLRSAIECFIKSILSITTPNIINEKSIYKIFDFAKADLYFSNGIVKNQLDQINNYYSQLCAVIHNSQTTLSNISAISYFPKYEESLSMNFVNMFTKSIDCMLTTCFIDFYKNVYDMHELNRSIYLNLINSDVKLKVIHEKMQQ